MAGVKEPIRSESAWTAGVNPTDWSEAERVGESMPRGSEEQRCCSGIFESAYAEELSLSERCISWGSQSRVVLREYDCRTRSDGPSSGTTGVNPTTNASAGGETLEGGTAIGCNAAAAAEPLILPLAVLLVLALLLLLLLLLLLVPSFDLTATASGEADAETKSLNSYALGVVGVACRAAPGEAAAEAAGMS